MSQELQVVIIDDVAAMRAALRSLLERIPNVVVAGEADGVKEGLALIRRLQPDIVFLDVEMKDGTGFDLLSRLEKRAVKVIFVTGHDDYAIKAFKFSAVDYLLKPVDLDDLMEALEKVSVREKSETQLNNLLNDHKTLSRIVLSDQRNTYLVELTDIVRVMSDVNYTRFFLRDERQIVVAKTLKVYDEMLTPSGFFRSHQSHLINLLFFDRLDKAEGGVIFMKNGEQVPISVRKKDDLIQALATFSTKNQ